ncbi:MAG: FtsW/RodA/SpoVE family cell cycle protein [Oscillospiraceae bacterium]
MKKALRWLGGYFKKLDKILLLICAAITVFDIIIVYSLWQNGFVKEKSFQTQVFAAVVGFCAAILIGMFDYRLMSKFWYLYAPFALLLQLLLFTPLALQRDDDIAWLDLGFITIQPSEILKIAFILTLATHISKVGDKLNNPLHLMLLCVHGLFPFLLVLVQGDAGSALVFLFIFLCMLFAAGISWKYLLTAVVASPIVFYVAWNYVMKDHHRARFTVLFDEQMQEAERLGIYMQQYRARIAMGSGQLKGLGFDSDSFTYVPEIYNDFIFSYIGMTLGFIGCMAVVIAYAVLCLKLLSNASASQDLLGKMICTGVFAMVTFHCIINIGVVIGVVPVIGIPLPFLSTGGTSMIMMYAALGPVLSIPTHKEKKRHMFYEEKD